VGHAFVSLADLSCQGKRGILKMSESFAIISVTVLMATSIILTLNLSWRINIAALGIQYLAAFFLFILVFPLTLAAVKLFVGWMSIAILGSATPAVEDIKRTSINRAGRLFRLMASGLAVILTFSIAPFVVNIIPTGLVIVWGGLILVVMGLLQLGMTTRPANVVMGLLTILCGFDILYASVETSVLVVGLLALTTFGLALSGSYFINSEIEEEEI
jgi:hypothetical protein